MEKYVVDILRRLHRDSGRPRLEIEGVGELSYQTGYLPIFPRTPLAQRESLVAYILNDFYSESGGGSHNYWDWVTFQRKVLEELVTSSILRESSKQRSRIQGTHVTFSNYWNAEGEGWEQPEKGEVIEVELMFHYINGNPALLVEHQGTSLHEFNIGDMGLYIAHIGDKIILKSFTHRVDNLPMSLDIPTPYNNDSEQTASSTYDTWDNRHLKFEISGRFLNAAIIDISIYEQGGYWYYGSLSDTVPLNELKGRKRLTVREIDPYNVDISLQDKK